MARKRTGSGNSQAARPGPEASGSQSLSDSKKNNSASCQSIRFDLAHNPLPGIPDSSPPPGALSAAAVVNKIWSKTRLQVSFVDAETYDPTGIIRLRIRTVVQLWSDAALGGINFDWSDKMQYLSLIHI